MRFGTLPNSGDRYALVALPTRAFDRFLLSLIPGRWHDHFILGEIRVLDEDFTRTMTRREVAGVEQKATR